jgi:hypothetical protein
MIGAILGGLSAVASSIAAIKNFQSAQDAQKSANLYGQQFAGITETDKYKAVKSADISSSLNQETAARNSSYIQALQGMGAESAAGVIGIINQQANEANLKAAEEQAKLDAQIALSKAEGAQGVEARNIAAQREFKQKQFEDAQTEAAQRRANVQSGIQGVVGGLGMAAGDIVGLSAFDYDSAELKAKMAERQASRQANKTKRQSVNDGSYFGFDQSTPAYEGDFNTPMLTSQQASLLSGLQY